MVNRINELAKAELRHEFRRLYKDLGYFAMIQVLYELMVSVEICSDVIREEVIKEDRENEEKKD